MVKLARRRRCQAITAVTAAALLSGSVYLATSRKRPELTLEEVSFQLCGLLTDFLSVSFNEFCKLDVHNRDGK
jgi:hypothetical protein